ncbi:MAG TPA: GDSL-type esterase/lipase family protein, partial [Longimicrobium sp.]|nr:GDSL-type esterase/lipase family protein [Longimicrobium sp.]
TEAGFFSRELSRLLASGRPVSPGFLWPDMVAPGDVTVVTLGRRRDWREDSWLEPQAQGPFGPRGVAFAAVRPGALLELRASTPLPAGTRLTVFYAPLPNHRPAELRAGTKVLARFVPPKEPTVSPLGQVEVTWPSRATTLQLAVDGGTDPGEFRLYGFSVERPDAVLSYDALGVRGTTSDHPVKRDDGALLEFLRQRPPDVLVVWFGTNSAVWKPFPPDVFRQSFTTLVEKLRGVVPDASLVVIGPPDLQKRPEGCGAWAFKKRRRLYPREREALKVFACDPENSVIQRPGKPPRYSAEGVNTEAQWRTWLATCAFASFPSVEQVTAIEREVALSAGGLFFDTYAFMGGGGAMHRWVCEQPQLGEFDHIHLTPEGHAKLAGALWDAIRTGSR